MIDGNETIIIRQVGLSTGIVRGNALVLFMQTESGSEIQAGQRLKIARSYVHYNNNDVERTAWMIPNKNSEYTVTLNVDDRNLWIYAQ